MNISINKNSSVYPNKQKSFKSKVHIIDGFHHADNMEHFAKATLKKIGNISDLQMHYVECNSKDINSKQLGDVENTLKSISDSLNKGDFLAIPGLAVVPILNLQERIKNILKQNVYLTANNLKTHHFVLLKFLKDIYNNKKMYEGEIRTLDKNGQQLEYAYGVINEISKLREKGVNVYMPAGHGADATIKWMAKKSNLNDELYKYISTGKDNGGEIQEILNKADRNNFYDFNLLSLSNAKIVNIKNLKNQNYIFSSKDGYVNDSERGVYNFTPVRNSSGEILGYSYHDEKTVEYPYSEFHANNQIQNLCKYVGLPLSDFYPSLKEILQFKEKIKKGNSTSFLPDKLYPIKDIYESNEIEGRKLDILGRLINKDGLVFDTNHSGKIIFHKTNCEGSEKPSVLQMWGSCFASINAMLRDLQKSSISDKINVGNKCSL